MANLLSFPQDVPWRRLAISQDMYVPSLGAMSSTPRWKSSLAVFFYDAPADPQFSDPSETTTFLRVVATVTGVIHVDYYADPLVAGLLLPGFSSYYPALSAVVQVGVFPGDTTVTDYSLFPYFSDFEPKKREVMELATDNNEALTHSDSDINVRKGTTTTDGTENTIQNTVYTNNNANETQATTVTRPPENVTYDTKDSILEQRFTNSYSTNLSQLYQVLDGYHVGTNNALFFINARPHLIDSPYTFINGPRRLEGIQEFFLVVQRPTESGGLCVKATLETAHLDVPPNFPTNPGNLGQTGSPEQPLQGLYTMFITQRDVSGCVDGEGNVTVLPADYSQGGDIQINEPSVVYENAMTPDFSTLMQTASQSGKQAVYAANAISRSIRDRVVSSFDPAVRYLPGTVSMNQSSFALRRLLAPLGPNVGGRSAKLSAPLKQAASALNMRQSAPLTAKDLTSRKQLVQALGIPRISASPAHKK